MIHSAKHILAGVLAGILAASPAVINASASLSPDLNGDGSINALDAAIILQYAAQVGAGSQQTMEEFVAALLGQEVPEQTTWQAAYLEEIHKTPDYEDSHYALLYIDEDEIPELVIWHASYGGIYNYVDSSVNCLDANVLRYGLQGYIKSKGIFCISWISYGKPLQGYKFFRISGSKAQTIEEFQKETTDTGFIHTINGIEVSQEEYENRYMEYNVQFMEYALVTYEDILVKLEQS